MYKLIAIDLDGTLLNSYGEISQINKETIKEALNKNVQIVLTSGRALNSTRNFSLDLNINNYLICSNGAIVYDIKNNKNIYANPIPKAKALQIIEFCKKNSIFCSVSLDNSIVAESLNFNILCHHSENSKKSEEKKTNITITENIYKYLSELDKEIFKISICDNSEIIFTSIIKKLREMGNIDVLDVGHMSSKIIKSGTLDVLVEYFYTEITNENVNKWNALEFLINYLDIKKEEVIAIGDNVNDKLMIENAGLGIIMKNAAPYLKKIADIEVSDNNSNGVAEAIKKYT